MPDPSPQLRSLTWLAAGEEGGGIPVALINLAAECRRRGHRVTVIALADGPVVVAARRRGLDVVILGLPKPRNFAGNIVQKLARLLESRRYRQQHAGTIARAIRAVDGETLHVLSPSLLRLACAAAALAKVKAIWEMPNTMSDRIPLQLNRRLYRHVIRKNDALVLADSAYTAATIRGRGVEPIVFYHAVDAGRSDPDQTTPALAAEPGVVTIGIIARLVPDKGQAQAVEAIALLKDAPGLRLLLVGGPLDSPFAQQLQRRVAALGLTDRVRFVGPVDEPAAWLASCDFTISARTVEEPFGISIVEAQLMRKPVLVRALGGPAKIVLDGTTGWHLDDRQGVTGEAVAAGIRRALDDRRLWQQMGVAGRERSLATFSAHVLADRYLSLLYINNGSAR